MLFIAIYVLSILLVIFIANWRRASLANWLCYALILGPLAIPVAFFAPAKQKLK